MRTDKPQLKVTRDYSIFKSHEFNRPLAEKKELLESMRTHGFMPSSAIQVARDRDGKFKVVRGHHRLMCAKQLGLPVWYIVDESNTDIFSLEGAPSTWSLDDFTVARAHAGQGDYLKLIEFRQRYGLPLGVAASLLGGEGANSNNKSRQIKSGRFKVADDLSHALEVVSVTDFCWALGLRCARSAAFVSAVSRCLRVPEFKAEIFMHKMEKHWGQFAPRSTSDGCLFEIEQIYNYGAKQNRLPLVFRAREEGRKRQASFAKA